MNTLGTLYRTTIFGESHGIEVGAVIDGCPPGVELSEQDLFADLDRRRAGAKGTTTRKESDSPRIVSGIFNGYTTGAPITIIFKNENTLSGDYRNLIEHPRPGHADFVARIKYNGFADYRGGGHFSGRITLGSVVSGTIAKKVLSTQGIKISAELISMGGTKDKSKFSGIIEKVMKESDSVGGVAECRISGMPVGVGEPFFNSVESLISHAIFSMPAVRGIEFGEGFAAASRLGSEHNDAILTKEGITASNNAGGINGGITNGNDIVFRVAVKPTSSIAKPQDSYNFEHGKIETLRVKGRHDACIALRTPVIIESMAAMVILDLMKVK